MYQFSPKPCQGRVLQGFPPNPKIPGGPLGPWVGCLLALCGPLAYTTPGDCRWRISGLVEAGSGLSSHSTDVQVPADLAGALGTKGTLGRCMVFQPATLIQRACGHAADPCNRPQAHKGRIGDAPGAQGAQAILRVLGESLWNPSLGGFEGKWPHPKGSWVPWKPLLA